MQALVVAERVIAQVFKDKRTMAMMFLAPLFVLYLLFTILGSSSDNVTIGTVGLPASFEQIVKEETPARSYASREAAEEAMKELQITALVYLENETPYILIEGGDVSKNAQALRVIQSALTKQSAEQGQAVNKQLLEQIKQLQAQLGQEVSVPAEVAPMAVRNPQIDFLYGDKDAGLFDQTAPALMGFFIFLFVFIISGVSFLRERSSGTLERTLVTPLKRSSIVWGYFIGFFLFVVIQTLLIQLFMVNVLDVTQSGSYSLLLLVNVLTASVALSLGLLLSSFAKSEFQLIQFIPLAIVPQIFFSGIFDLSDAPTWVEVVNRLMPLTYAAHALQNIMTRGAGIDTIGIDLLMLAGFIAVFVLLNMRVLRKERPV
ncbi:ABC transporter permease [Domibacillus sp. PGB-M46]|uniref:ABC transporter permease n=1 Tax=Domibacillus sp. PGB-M46 TaxID=2910255 RepID=UPI001F573D46|nr:ABC transporter permease [Domibacillus sp. PGB-M46]MCI2256794.1 ABC transporter permease [Domibacillus sp. PGB-M46]